MKDSRAAALTAAAIPNPAGQPQREAIHGAASAPSPLAAFAEPTSPSTQPCRSAGYHRLARGRATAKLPPAIPRRRPAPASVPKVRAPSQIQTSGTSVSAWHASAVRRAPKRSTRIPSGTRTSEPPRSGRATRSPIWEAESPRSAAIGRESAPGSSQTRYPVAK